jgi:hypothetical protein
VREAALEAACNRHAAKRGVPSVKLQGGTTGMPDRLYLLPGGRCWLVEFKTATGRLSPRQLLVHAALAQRDHPVTVVRTTDQFKRALDWLLGEL